MTNRVLKILLICLVLFQTVSIFAEELQGTEVASVNGKVINSDDVMRELNTMYQQALSQGVYPDASEMEKYKDTALDLLIGRELLYQDAVAQGTKVDQKAVDDYINALTTNYGGIEPLEAALSAQGMTIEKLRSDTERYQVISAFVEREMRPEIAVSDDEGLAYYNENKEYFRTEETVRASHILIKIDDNADEAEKAAALEKVKGLRERIVAGEDFAELAREYSDCPSSEKGGDLGEFGHGMMVPPFDNAAFALDPGELSQPVLTQFGYHLILLTEKNSGDTVNFNDVRQQIVDYLANLKLQDRVNSYVDDLRVKADVKLFQATDAKSN